MLTLLTRDECRLVQASFAQIEPVAEHFATKFYERLFTLNPNLVPLFKGDMEKQGVRFMEKLAVAVVGLEDLESIAPLVQRLGRRHAGYGVEPTHYETAREALLWALREGLGSAFNAEVSSAWSAAFTIISAEMIRSGDSGS
ncbi:MAG: globin family protein [Candidatus Velthaea sp.]|jgi:hemoglobin-like flavoprotein